MIIPGQTCHQVLSKFLEKKKLLWYKCDFYFIGDNQVFIKFFNLIIQILILNRKIMKPIESYMDSQVLCSKEICIFERSLFILSLIPISINLCIKANKKKNINTVLQPIFDHYQIKSNNCLIYLV
jgi:hypothetical protein